MKTEHPTGRLVIVGGGEDRDGQMEILTEFVNLAGGPEEARIVVLTAASTEPETQDERYRTAFVDKLKVRDFRLVVTDNRRDAERAANVAAIDRATGVFFTGGDQKRIMRILNETKLEQELERRYRKEGLVIGGTSAGASVMSHLMLNDGDSKECPRQGVVDLAEGLGLLPGTIIDQHFAQRGRLGRLLAAVAMKPEALGIGLGEDTAMIVEDGTFRVIGRGVATVLDGTGLRYNDEGTQRRNAPLTLSGIVLHTIGDGHRFDLATRQLVPPGTPGAGT